MGTMVLRTKDCLEDGFNHLQNFRQSLPSPARSYRKKPGRSSSPPSPPHPPPTTRSNRSAPASNKSKPRANHRRVSVSDKQNRTQTVVKSPPKPLVMGQVTILKRGEELLPDPTVDQVSDGGDEQVVVLPRPVFSSDRIGQAKPEFQRKQMSVDMKKTVYAGPAFCVSPSPSSLPVPSFSILKKSADEATKDLLGLLRLDCVA